MTVSTTASQTILGGNGATTVFDFSFIAVATADIEVIYTNANGSETTLSPSQYSITLNPVGTGQLWSVGGTVSYPLIGSPIASGTTLTIQRILPLVQETSIQDQGDFAPQVTEEALDILCMEIQQVAARTGQFRETWVSGIAYNFGDIVVDGVNGNNTTNWYLCSIGNTSSTWSLDLAAGYWTLILNMQSIANPGTVAAGGDLTGNYPNPTIAKIQGHALTVAGITGTGNIVQSISPALTGTPTTPTASPGTNTTQQANTAFVAAAVGALGTATSPTIQQFTSGSGTYNTPANVKWIRARMAGGGGGSSGSSNASSDSGSGGTGGNTIFGTTLLVANGGTGGTGSSNVGAGGTGGSASFGAASGIALSGGGGQAVVQTGGSNSSPGTFGGVNAFGGNARAPAQGAAGLAGATNTGAGGSGPGASTSSISGAGGGAGGYVDAIISAPSATYSYAVGASGSAGTAGTGGSVGGAGAAGIIVIEEHYTY